MRRLLWILLAVLTVALVVLVLQQNEVALGRAHSLGHLFARNENHGACARSHGRARAVWPTFFPRAAIRHCLGLDRAHFGARLRLSLRVARCGRPGAGTTCPRTGRDQRTYGRDRARSGRKLLGRDASQRRAHCHGARHRRERCRAHPGSRQGRRPAARSPQLFRAMSIPRTVGRARRRSRSTGCRSAASPSARCRP